MDFSLRWFSENKISEQSYNSVDALETTLLKVWDDIEADYLRCTVGSVVARSKACVETEGLNIEYIPPQMIS